MPSVAPLPTVLSTSAAPTTTTSNDNSETMQLLRSENTKLKKEVDTLKKERGGLLQENADLKRKRKASDSGKEPASKKCKTPTQRRKLFEKWAKALVRESAKSKITNGWGGEIYSATVKETTPWAKADFESIFAGHGTQIQPTPENKPTSQITILRLETPADIRRLFADAEIKEDGYTVQAWRSRNFSKSYKTGMYHGSVKYLDVQFNKSKGTLQLEFGMETDDGDVYC